MTASSMVRPSGRLIERREEGAGDGSPGSAVVAGGGVPVVAQASLLQLPFCPEQQPPSPDSAAGVAHPQPPPLALETGMRLAEVE